MSSSMIVKKDVKIQTILLDMCMKFLLCLLDYYDCLFES